jgi:hypothetical protein
VMSWVIYMRTYRPRHAPFVRLIFFIHAALRYAWFATVGRLRNPADAATRSSAYRRHLRTLLRIRL